ncbi:MAG: NAD(P)H-dependent oxidoreductase [Sphingomonas sp.]|nr:NAD(P)H-dependent oxidoreductase [Sphingomonas sp.]
MTILHIDSSITGDASVSRTISSAIVERLRRETPAAQLIRRDLVEQPLAHLTLESFADTAVLDEFLAADTVVIGAPMYNFTLPSQLKAWLDRILVSGTTFRYTADGPEGLVKDKRVIVALARGGIYDAGSGAAPLEHLETYLRGTFNFIGIDPEFVAADGLNLGAEQKESAVRAALGETVRLAA